MNRSLALPLTLALCALAPSPAQAQKKKVKLTKRKTVTFNSLDGLKISADLYAGKNKQAPVMILCHQARSSRGEYRKIAPILQRRGFTCLAIDQRSGKKWKRVKNETAKRAKKKKKPTGYLDAEQDIEAAILWVRTQGYSGKLVLWGSSYSASLVLLVASKRSDVQAVLCFSPGEYFQPKDLIRTQVKRLKNTPVFIAAPLKEKPQYLPIYKAIDGSCLPQFTADPKILHGARTLVQGSYAKDLWKYGVDPFLEQFVVKAPQKKQKKPKQPKPAKKP